MRIHRSSVRLCLIAVALLTGCGAAQTSSDMTRSGRSPRQAALLDCPGDDLPEAVIQALVQRGYVNDVPIADGEPTPGQDVVDTLNRLAARVDATDAGFYFDQTPTAFGTSLAWVDNPATGEVELLLLAGFHESYDGGDPYAYSANPYSAGTNQFALAVMSCTPAGLWESVGVADYSRFTGSELISGYHVVETRTGPLYLVGIRSHEYASSSSFDTLHVFAPPGAPVSSEYPPTAITPAVAWNASSEYLGMINMGYSGSFVGTDIMPSSGVLPLIVDPDDPTDSFHPEYYSDYALPEVTVGERMLVSFELVTSEEYSDDYSDALDQYLDALEQEYDDSAYGGGLYGGIGDSYGIIQALTPLQYLEGESLGGLSGYEGSSLQGGYLLYGGEGLDSVAPLYGAEPVYDDELYGGSISIGTIHTTGRGSGSLAAPEESVTEGSGGLDVEPTADVSNAALLQGLTSDDNSTIITDILTGAYGESSIGSIGTLEYGLGDASAFGADSLTRLYQIRRELIVRSVVRVGADEFHSGSATPTRGWVILARGTQPRNCNRDGQPMCMPLHPDDQALMVGSELAATWFAGHFETWRLAAAAAADWQLATDDFLIVGTASNLRQYADDGTWIDPSTIHPRLRTSVLLTSEAR